jgi:hypothetical protein
MTRLWKWLTDFSCFEERYYGFCLELERTFKISFWIGVIILSAMFFIQFISFGKEL